MSLDILSREILSFLFNFLLLFIGGSVIAVVGKSIVQEWWKRKAEFIQSISAAETKEQ